MDGSPRLPQALSLFAGAGGGDLGLTRAGFAIVAHCEIEEHAQAVLRYHYPERPAVADVRDVRGDAYAGLDVIVGGSPCQDLSVAGERAGLSGERSGLFWEQMRVWRESDAPNLLWENVRGALSSNGGRDFAAILGAVVGTAVPLPTRGWGRAGVVAGPTGVAAFRVLDLRHFGPPQRRRRVFVCGARAGGVDPEAVLFERESVPGGSPASGEAGQDAAGGAPRGVHGRSRGRGTLAFDWAARAGEQGLRFRNEESGPLVTARVPAVMAFDTTQITSKLNRSRIEPGRPCPTLAASAHPPAVCVTGAPYSHALTSEADQVQLSGGRPRRLMPVECERLMGWPDDWTRYGRRTDGTVYELKDAARYRLCGNGIGAPVTHWIGLRFARELRRLRLATQVTR